MITKNKFVSISYELRTEQNGELLEAAGVDQPLEFICGQGQILEYFEMNLLDKKKGDSFDFKIAAANGYGDVNQDMIVELPKDIFKEVESADMVIGSMIPMMDSLGRRLQGKILSIGEEDVKIDFNHPLAGKDLYFKGEVLSERNATDEELEALHSHKCGGCSSCGSDGEGSCDGGCGSHDEGCGCCH
ncbi:MAG: peptidylprolyl isomerase [Odoribacter sp.]